MLSIVFFHGSGEEKEAVCEGVKGKERQRFFLLLSWVSLPTHCDSKRSGAPTTSIPLVHFLNVCQSQSWLASHEEEKKKSGVQGGRGAVSTRLRSHFLTNVVILFHENLFQYSN